MQLLGIETYLKNDNCNILYSDHDARIFIPRQQWVLPIFRSCIGNVRPPIHEVFVACQPCQLPGDGTIDVFHHIKVGGKENIKVSLVNL